MTSKTIDEPKKIYGERIRSFRKYLGLTLERFAQPLSIKGNSVSDYERGKARASEAVLRELEMYYQLNRVWYETGEGEMRLPITGTSGEGMSFSEKSMGTAGEQQEAQTIRQRLGNQDFSPQVLQMAGFLDLMTKYMTDEERDAFARELFEDTVRKLKDRKK